MTTTLDVDEILARQLRPPPTPRSHLAMARTMTLPDGDRVGEPWDPDTEPIQTVFVRALDSGRYGLFSLATPSQRGKSMMAIALPLIRTLTELAAPVAYVMPNLEKLAQQWEGKIAPMIRGCGYGAWLPEKGPGSRGGKPSALTLRNPHTGNRAGTLYFMAASGGGKETSLASVSALLTAKDEADDFASAGHLQLADKRGIGYGDQAISIEASTINEVKGRTSGHPILQRYAQGTRTRLWFQCPHCADKGDRAGYQILAMDRLIYSGTSKAEAAASARFRCEYCAALWTESDRQRALSRWLEVHHTQTVDAHGHVVGEPPLGRHYSLLANDLEWTRSSMASIAEEHFVAAEALRERGNHDLMRLYYYKRGCLEYTADIEELELGAELTWQHLLARSQQCTWGSVRAVTDKGDADGYLYSRHENDMTTQPPAGAEWCFAGVDVQHNRVYPSVIAGNREGTTWDVAWSYQYARRDHTPWNEGELHRLLDDVDLWLHLVCGNLPLMMAGLDTGDSTKELHNWLAGKRGGIWRAIKGTGETLKPQPGDVEGLLWRRNGLHLIHDDQSRELVHSAFRRPNGTPGAAHIPKGLNNTASDRAYLQHLVAEMPVVDPKTRKVRIRQGPGRWDWLDSRRIATALMRLHLSTLNRPKRIVRVGVVGKVA